MIVDIVEDVVHEPLSQGQRPGESIPERFGKEKLAPYGGNIGHRGEGKSEVQSGFFKSLGILAGSGIEHGFGSTF
jgi:hypothetical protein